jgi:hypothetical protein
MGDKQLNSESLVFVASERDVVELTCGSTGSTSVGVADPTQPARVHTRIMAESKRGGLCKVSPEISYPYTAKI